MRWTEGIEWTRKTGQEMIIVEAGGMECVDAHDGPSTFTRAWKFSLINASGMTSMPSTFWSSKIQEDLELWHFILTHEMEGLGLHKDNSCLKKRRNGNIEIFTYVT